jgi:hypothetical protein
MLALNAPKKGRPRQMFAPSQPLSPVAEGTPVSQMLEQLEAQLANLPAEATKHDMEAGFEVMAQWTQALDSGRRGEVLSQLPAWLRETHAWHSRAAMEIALRVRDLSLLEAAVGEANSIGVIDLAGGEGYPPWLIFHLYLLSTVSRWQGDSGEVVRTYLANLRAGVGATSHSRRLLGIRAWFTECLLAGGERQKPCVSQGLAQLRKWHDERLLRSGLSLLHAYFGSTAEGVTFLKDALTPEEFAIACPDLVSH